MAGIKNRLRLYDRAFGSNEDDREPVDTQPSVQLPSLAPKHFGDAEFRAHAEAVYVRRERLENPVLGSVRLDDHLPLRLSGILELALWPRPEALHPEDILFLDTETTGLSRGAGTLPFLTGLAYFERNALIVEQIYLDNPGGEDAYLDYLKDTMGRFEYLVSYNGRSFDVPLIRNRLIVNRKSGLRDVPHFDLLHIFRRLFPKGSLPGYKQQNLEQELLQFERDEDIPGAEIPQIYFDYVKYGHDGGMADVFAHNFRDLQGMVLIFLEAIRIYDGREGARGALRSGLARILLRNRREDEALQFLESIAGEREDALNSDEAAEVLRYRDLLLLGQLYRSRGAVDKAVAIFRRVIDRYDCAYARMSVAKLYEHRLRDFGAALRYTDELIDRFHGAGVDQPPARGLYSRAELDKRRARILRKMRSS